MPLSPRRSLTYRGQWPAILGDNSLIGIGATVLNKAVVGKNCLIGAHALVPEGKAHASHVPVAQLSSLHSKTYVYMNH